MDIEQLAVSLVVLLPLLVTGEALFVLLVWKLNGWETPSLGQPPHIGHGRRGRIATDAVIIGTWLALSGFLVWCEFVLAFVGVHTLLFTLGGAAAWIGLMTSAVLLVVTPIAVGTLMRRRIHHG